MAASLFFPEDYGTLRLVLSGVAYLMRLHRNSAVRFALAAAVLLAAGMLLSACGQRNQDQSQSGGVASDANTGPRVLRRGLGGEPGALDPQIADDTFAFEVLRDLYEGLTVSAPSGEVQGGAAEAWSVEDKGTRYVFRLRPGLTWSNGDPLTAGHFVLGLRRAVDPATASPGADLLRVISQASEVIEGKRPPTDLGVKALDDRTLEIRLVRPAPYLPDILTNSVAMPVHPRVAAAAVPGTALTNGAYVLVEASPGSVIILRRNPRYWNSAAVTFDEVRYFPLADESVEFNRFRAGEIDVTNNVPTARFQELQRDPAAGLQVRPNLATFFFGFNAEQGPLKGRPQLREALSLAIDREAITQLVTRAGQSPAYSLVPPGVWNYSSPTLAWSSQGREARVARARELYAAAGYSPDKPLRLRVVYNQNELIKSVTLATAAMWKEALGVECELIQLEHRVYLQTRDDRSQWDVIRLGWSADFNDASSFLDTLLSHGVQNHGAWSNAEYDRLIALAHAEPDVALRRDLLERAEGIAMADYAVAPVYYYVTRRLVRPGIDAGELNPLNRNYSRNFRYARQP